VRAKQVRTVLGSMWWYGIGIGGEGWDRVVMAVGYGTGCRKGIGGVGKGISRC